MDTRYQRCVLFVTLIGVLMLLPVAATAQPTGVAVTTQHYDNQRTGENASETVLTPATVSGGNFGFEFSYNLDANVSGQPLYVPNLIVGGQAHNVVFVETNNNTPNSPSSVYAWDADDANQRAPLWRVKFGRSAAWITASPVIDPSTGTLYALTKDMGVNSDGQSWLHAINIETGVEDPGSPVQIAGSVPGKGEGSAHGVLAFDSQFHNSRPGLLFANGNVYCAFSSTPDRDPYHGWVFAYHYDGTQFTQVAVFCTTPNGGRGGVWMGGKGLMADAAGNIYFASGNGTETVKTGGADYGMCYLKLNGYNLTVEDWFSPFDEEDSSRDDYDLGCAGVLMIPGTNLMMGGSDKQGEAYLMNMNDLGGFTLGGPDNVVARLANLNPTITQGQNFVCWNEGAYVYLYLWVIGAQPIQLRFDPSVGTLNPVSVFETSTISTGGGQLAVSSNGTANGILWAIDNGGVLRAFNAADISQPELWDSNMNKSRDNLGAAGHWEFPLIDNARVYAANGERQLRVYGIRQLAPKPAISPSVRSFSGMLTVTLSDSDPNAVIYYTTNGNTPTAASNLYSGPFTISGPTTIKAVATHIGLVNSPIVEHVYD
jgi:hypothetical protein